MKPVAVFRFSPTEGPGYFATFLDRHGIPWRLIKLDEGDPVPTDLDAYAGFVFMGGPMSVNDELPWIPPVLELIRRAVGADRPCLGHCLGGQLISKALGGVVTRNPIKEIGWHEVKVEDNDEARKWLSGVDHFTTFQWHGETFTLPSGATRILTGPNCANQAYVLGKHLGMQCHVEMTPEMIEAWCKDGAPEIKDAIESGRDKAVAKPEEIRAKAPRQLPELNAIADRLYTQWVGQLAR
jgi:GMP synthase-like glutamine amidotransferase